MADETKCPNCDNIYGNEPRKIPCGHIVCHKCCLELFNKEENTLECPQCYTVHTFKSKNIFKKSLQQVAHAGFGKKTSTREVSFALCMPMEKASGAEKSANKEVKKAAANLPTAPPGAPPDTSPVPPPPPPPPPPPEPVVAIPKPPRPEPVVTIPKPPPPEPVAAIPKPPPPVPLMPQTRPPMPDPMSKLVKQKQPTSINTTPPSLLTTIVSPPTPTPPIPPVSGPSAPESVIARCHSCGNKCQVTVCEHCDHFVCFECERKHRATSKVDVQSLTNKWQECKNKYNILRQKLNQYNRERSSVDSDLAAIRVAVETRAQAALQAIIEQRDRLTTRIDEHIKKEQTINNVKHHELADEFQQIRNRYESALNGEDIGSYTQEDFLRDIRELQSRLNKRNDLIDTHVLKVPTIGRYERISIEKLLGELHFNPSKSNGTTHPTIPSLINNRHIPTQNGFSEYPSFASATMPSNHSPKFPPGMPVPPSQPPPPPSSSTVNVITPPSQSISLSNDLPSVKPLMGETYTNGTVDTFDEFRRMAAQIHQQFNAPYSKVINAASSFSPPIATTDGTVSNGAIDKNPRTTFPTAPNKPLPPNNFMKLWKVEHTAVPNFLCMTPYPTPKVFVVDKYGKVSICCIPAKQTKQFESYALFPNGTDEWIESVVASSRFLIVYSRKKQDTMTGTIHFFNHECKPVLTTGIHQSIPVHHILCDQNANRLYCLDRMRYTIYYHPLPNSPNEIESCLKTRRDFIQFNSNYIALKMLQNDDILGFYERNDCTVHLYCKQTGEKLEEFKCEHFMDKFESWGIIAIRKDNNSLIFKIDERADHDAVTRQHIVYEVNRSTKQIISKIQLNSVFGMIIGPNNEVILGIRQTKDNGVVQCYIRK